MAKPFKVRSWMICDDVRIENNGKYILVGVYSGAIRLRKPPPITIPTLTLWLQLDLTRTDYGDYELRLLDPRKEAAARFRGRAQFKRMDEPAVLIWSVGPMKVPDYGIYRLEFGMGTPPVLLGTFAVCPAQDTSPFEAARISYPAAAAGLAHQH
jgi:hypothetical protein